MLGWAGFLPPVPGAESSGSQDTAPGDNIQIIAVSTEEDLDQICTDKERQMMGMAIWKFKSN